MSKKRVTGQVLICVTTFLSFSMIADANIPITPRGPITQNQARTDPLIGIPTLEVTVQQQLLHASRVAQFVAEPEEMLLEVYQTLQTGRLEAAQAKAAALVEKFPKFSLGHFIHGDLLLMRSTPVSKFGEAATGNDEGIAGFREEAAVRLAALTERPDPNKVPKSVLKLAEEQRYVLLVDTSRSRMFLYKNAGDRVELVKDFYISQGKNGAHKVRQGDKKTPIGVYEVTSHLSSNQLSPFYGAGALPINYPNAWDTVQRRTGYGIWLHGVPKETYNRAPKSSAGCVVLTNEDMSELAGLIDVGNTPVIISDQEEFVTMEQQAQQREEALAMLTKWQDAVTIGGADRLAQHYSKTFKGTGGKPVSEWLQQAHATVNATKPAAISDVQAFNYPGEGNLVAISFTRTLEISAVQTSERIQQYWSLEEGQWRIVSEAQIQKK